MAQTIKNHLKCRRPGLGSWVGMVPWRRIAVLPDPGIEPRSPAFQADSLPTELSGKPHTMEYYLAKQRNELPMLTITWTKIFDIC